MPGKKQLHVWSYQTETITSKPVKSFIKISTQVAGVEQCPASLDTAFV